MGQKLAILAWPAAALAAGAVFSALRIPVGWLLGPMLVCMALRLRLTLPERARSGGVLLAQWLIGALLGAKFSVAVLKSGMGYAPALVALVLLTAGLCMLNSYFLKRLAGVDFGAAFLGTLPGAASAIIAMAEEMQVDRLMVAVLMYVRVIVVIVLGPLILAVLFPDAAKHAVAAAGGAAAAPTLPWMLLTAVLAVPGALAAKLCRMPSPNFMGPFLLLMIIRCVFPALPLGLPGWALPLGMLLLGVSVGAQFDIRQLRSCWKAALVQAWLVCVLLALCTLAGYAFHRLSGVDMLTAMLGTMPGAKDAMIAMSIEMGGNVELVTIMQTLRLLIILFLGPPLAAWLAKLRQGAPAG